MITPQPSIHLPDRITAPIAWEAADYLMNNTDWRIILVATSPLTLDIEYHEKFRDVLGDHEAWRSIDIAKTLVATWICETVRTELNKTSVRRMSLQVPQEGAPDVFLEGLKGRLCFALRGALQGHFNQSLKQWERDAWTRLGYLEDPIDQTRFRSYVGLNQLVSEDAARKALKYVHRRMHWHIAHDGRWFDLRPDWRFERAAPRRNAADEATRARALVCRCLEVLVADDLDRRFAGEKPGTVTRETLLDDLSQRFASDGVWGLINLVLVRDRMVFSLPSPDMDQAVTREIVERQHGRLFAPRRMRFAKS